MSSLSAIQRSRIASYRRKKSGDSLERPGRPGPDSEPYSDAANSPLRGGEGADQQHEPLTRPVGLTDGGAGGNASSTGAAHQHQHIDGAPHLLPPDVMSYILQLEQQNADLRRTIQELQQQQSVLGSMPADPHSFEEQKRALLRDVLGQVEGIVSAHQTRSSAEIQRYKLEADRSNLALQTLRTAIQQEGMDLHLAPALISFHRRQQKQAQLLKAQVGRGAAASSLRNGDDNDKENSSGNNNNNNNAGFSSFPGLAPLGLSMPPAAQQMLDTIAEDLLVRLLSVQNSDDVPSEVRQAVKEAFYGVVVQVTDELVASSEAYEEMVSDLRRELNETREETRLMQLAFDAFRVQSEADRQNEIQVLRDELKTFYHASDQQQMLLEGGGANKHELTQTVHERAFSEYSAMLLDARRELEHMRVELENERNQSAQVCLRLKTALQRRNDEFERALVSRVEQVVADREARIADLERRLREKEGIPKAFRTFGTQAGEPSVRVPTSDSFVPTLLSAVGGGRDRSGLYANEEFERGVWRKTQELLSKYSESTRASSQPAIGA